MPAASAEGAVATGILAGVGGKELAYQLRDICASMELILSRVFVRTFATWPSSGDDLRLDEFVCRSSVMTSSRRCRSSPSSFFLMRSNLAFREARSRILTTSERAPARLALPSCRPAEGSEIDVDLNQWPTRDKRSGELELSVVAIEAVRPSHQTAFASIPDVAALQGIALP